MKRQYYIEVNGEPFMCFQKHQQQGTVIVVCSRNEQDKVKRFDTYSDAMYTLGRINQIAPDLDTDIVEGWVSS